MVISTTTIVNLTVVNLINPPSQLRKSRSMVACMGDSRRALEYRSSSKIMSHNARRVFRVTPVQQGFHTWVTREGLHRALGMDRATVGGRVERGTPVGFRGFERQTMGRRPGKLIGWRCKYWMDLIRGWTKVCRSGISNLTRTSNLNTRHHGEEQTFLQKLG